MKINLNDQIFTLHSGAHLSDLIAELLAAKKLADTRGIALAVNSQVIPKQDWPQTSLAENDQIVLIRATQGG